MRPGAKRLCLNFFLVRRVIDVFPLLNDLHSSHTCRQRQRGGAENTVSCNVHVRAFAEGFFAGGDPHLLVKNADEQKSVIVLFRLHAVWIQQAKELSRLSSPWRNY